MCVEEMGFYVVGCDGEWGGKVIGGIEKCGGGEVGMKWEESLISESVGEVGKERGMKGRELGKVVWEGGNGS